MAIAKTVKAQSNPQALLPIPVAVDLIRFEKNLLQIGFFGAHDTRHSNQSTRRIEQTVNRHGQKIKVSAEFRASQEFGLPSTSDRDKYIGFMRIAMQQRAKHGQLTNPIRFTGYRLLKELGLTFSGDNYEDINRWGQRMADTTITSEQVIYLAARKKYANKTVHVFRSFTRAGQSNLNDTGKTDSYEVVLEDWLLENLNQSYVVPEDFNSYRKLKRPTGKGIFGYLHLWFHASHGKPIEKDYGDLCLLLNIPAYRHVSKIKETMGRSLDELVSIGYLSQWDLRPMLTKDGYKLVLEAGEELLHVLSISQRKQMGNVVEQQQDLTEECTEALAAMIERGISPAKANTLSRQYDRDTILNQIEYAEFLISRDRRQKIDNPAGFLVYSIENQVPVPASFVRSRKLRECEPQTEENGVEESFDIDLRLGYDQWLEQQVDDTLRLRYPGQALNRKIKEVIRQRSCGDESFGNIIPSHQEAIAKQLLRREIQNEESLPSFSEWCQKRDQLLLF